MLKHPPQKSIMAQILTIDSPRLFLLILTLLVYCTGLMIIIITSILTVAVTTVFFIVLFINTELSDQFINNICLGLHKMLSTLKAQTIKCNLCRVSKEIQTDYQCFNVDTESQPLSVSADVDPDVEQTSIEEEAFISKVDPDVEQTSIEEEGDEQDNDDVAKELDSVDIIDRLQTIPNGYKVTRSKLESDVEDGCSDLVNSDIAMRIVSVNSFEIFCSNSTSQKSDSMDLNPTDQLAQTYQETMPKLSKNSVSEAEDDLQSVPLFAVDNLTMCESSFESSHLECSELNIVISLHSESSDDIGSLLLNLHSSPMNEHNLCISGQEQPGNNTTSAFTGVMKVYDAVHCHLHVLTFVRGCIIDNDSLLLLIDDNYNLQECHQQVMNVIPHDVEQNLVNVKYVSDTWGPNY
ncbi:hypothetical protein LSH36_163g00015 [Paralvinella palmiformis]|uniref:Uncharacterized protein n=1 Tax=Paralvinella palmiformis TaxID=53620 RepID=A0AAD9N808_9ANNE|nr:hypothetical protein LSH36_163g00015 [Paralvinella palmiformis]